MLLSDRMSCGFWRVCAYIEKERKFRNGHLAALKSSIAVFRDDSDDDNYEVEDADDDAEDSKLFCCVFVCEVTS